MSVTPNPPAVNPTVDDVLGWITAMTKKGLYPPNTGRFRRSALRELTTILGDDETRDAAWVLDHIDEIALRWLTRNNGNPSTKETYLSKAKTSLQDFFAFQRGEFTGRRRDPGKVKETKPKEKRQAESAVDATPVQQLITLPTPPKAAPPAPDVPTAAPAIRSCPLGDGRELFYNTPTKWTMRDALRAYFHLATLTEDFDPTVDPNNPQQVRLFLSKHE